MAAALAEGFAEVGAVTLEPAGPAPGPTVRVRSARDDGPRLLMVGHYDTVPHDGAGADPEVAVTADRVVARGAADMKGGLVVMLHALRLIGRHAPGAGPWEVVAVPDEELGTPWSRAVLRDAAAGARAALVFEPALPDGRLVRARKGVGTVTIEVAGRPAHAGRDPERGRSAIAAIADLVGHVEALADPRAGTTVAATTVAGGSAPNVIPGAARAQIDVRAERAAESRRVMDAVRTLARSVERSRGVTIAVSGGVHRPPKPVDSGTEELFAVYRGCAARIGISLDWTDVGGGSDANILAETGLATLDGLGVVGGELHGPGEYALIESLAERAALTALALQRLSA